MFKIDLCSFQAFFVQDTFQMFFCLLIHFLSIELKLVHLRSDYAKRTVSVIRRENFAHLSSGDTLALWKLVACRCALRCLLQQCCNNGVFVGGMIAVYSIIPKAKSSFSPHRKLIISRGSN